MGIWQFWQAADSVPPEGRWQLHRNDEVSNRFFGNLRMRPALKRAAALVWGTERFVPRATMSHSTGYLAGRGGLTPNRSLHHQPHISGPAKSGEGLDSSVPSQSGQGLLCQRHPWFILDVMQLVPTCLFRFGTWAKPAIFFFSFFSSFPLLDRIVRCPGSGHTRRPSGGANFLCVRQQHRADLHHGPESCRGHGSNAAR